MHCEYSICTNSILVHRSLSWVHSTYGKVESLAAGHKEMHNITLVDFFMSAVK